MIKRPVILISALICLSGTSAFQASAKSRSCEASYVAVNRATGAEFVFGEFVARGQCGSNGNRCRELARNLAHDCMRDHWNERWDRARPAKCRSNNVERYGFDDLKQKIESEACYRAWGTSAPVQMRITANTTGKNKVCRRQRELTDSYEVTPEICAGIKTKPIVPPVTTNNQAWDIPANDTLNATSNLKFPSSMPSINFPNGYKGCSSSEKKKIQRAWALAHYSTWIANEAMGWMKRKGEYRKAAWHHGLRTTGDNRTINYAARAWFGPMNDESFGEAKGTLNKVWNERFRGKSFTVMCRTNDDNKGAHPCYRNDPSTGNSISANHIVLRRVNFCANFFGSDRDDWSRTRTLTHELFHWVTSPKGHAIMDTHTHCHGGGNCSTNKAYGRERSRHLSNYDGGSGSRAKTRRVEHRKRALRNNDNYAWFIYDIGRAAYDHNWAKSVGLVPLNQFPAEGFPW